jgi:hypothetical protein
MQGIVTKNVAAGTLIAVPGKGNDPLLASNETSEVLEKQAQKSGMLQAQKCVGVARLEGFATESGSTAPSSCAPANCLIVSPYNPSNWHRGVRLGRGWHQ